MHAAIRADPAAKPKERKAPGEKKKWKQTPLTYDERKDRLKVGNVHVLGTSSLSPFTSICMLMLGYRTCCCTAWIPSSAYKQLSSELLVSWFFSWAFLILFEGSVLSGGKHAPGGRASKGR